MDLDTEHKCTTVGDLKRLINELDIQDDWILVTTEGDDAVDIKYIDSHWHGALTFGHE